MDARFVIAKHLDATPSRPGLVRLPFDGAVTGWLLVVFGTACGRIAFDPLDRADTSRQTYRDAVMQDGPVAYWRLGDTDAIARDETGRLDGTYSGTCVQAAGGAIAGDGDGALRFPAATTCRVDFPGHLALSGSAPFTLELWVNLEGRDGNISPLFMNQTRAGQSPVDGFAMVEGSMPGAYFERAAAGSNRTTPRHLLTIGVFEHLVGVYDGTQFVLYANGTQFGNSVADARAMDSSGATAVIGAYPIGFGNPHPQGILDEIAVYDHALSLERIQLHHDIGVNGPR